MRRFFFLVAVTLLVPLLGGYADAAPLEKLKVATASKTGANYYLLMEGGERLGIWKKHGLQVEWLPFSGASRVYKAIAAGAVDIGMGSTVGGVQAMARGVPMVMIYNTWVSWPNCIFVKTNSPIKKSGDLKGAKIAIVRFGGMNHSYGRAMIRGLGLEGDIKFIAAGGAGPSVAALKAGKVDAAVRTVEGMVNLIASGEVRKIACSNDYLAREWSDLGAFASKDLIKSRPQAVRKWADAVKEITRYIKQNRKWALEQMRSELHLSPKAAEIMYDLLMSFMEGGRIEKKMMENVTNFLIDSGVLKREKVPNIGDMYTTKFL